MCFLAEVSIPFVDLKYFGNNAYYCVNITSKPTQIGRAHV